MTLPAFGTMAIAVAVGAAPAGWAGERNCVIEWNEAFMTPVPEQSPPPAVVARNLAILHLAMHDACVALQSEGEASQMTGLQAAAHHVACVLFPARQASFDELWKSSATEDSAPSDDAAMIGRETASRWLEARADDGSAVTRHYVPQSGPGQWRRTGAEKRPPELPHWGKVAPFALDPAHESLPASPPAPTSEEFAAALEEVRLLGGAESNARTTEQTQAARFWSDFSYTSTPPGHWNAIARSVAAERALSAAESARLFACLNVAMADAGILCWRAKFHYNFWRPETALAHGGDAQWQPLLPAPPHPEYVSGHAAFSGAAAAVLEAWFGQDCSFSVSSDSMPGAVRRFSSFTACAEEICASRVFGGIHYRFSGEAGCRTGQAAAVAALKRVPGTTGRLTSVR